LIITGIGFEEPLSVEIGTGSCDSPTLVNDTITCDVNGPGGIQPVLVYINSKGYGSGDFTHDVPISIDSVNPLSGSYAGGVEVTI